MSTGRLSGPTLSANGGHNVRSAEVGNSGHGGELLGRRCVHCVNSWCELDVNWAEIAPARHPKRAPKSADQKAANTL